MSPPMRIRVTKEVDYHRVNQDYPTLRIEFEIPRDRNFRIRSMFKADWCPREDEIVEIVDKMLDVSPTFAPKLAMKMEAKREILQKLLASLDPMQSDEEKPNDIKERVR